MRNSFITFLDLIFPFFLGLVVLIALPFFRSSGDSKVKVSFFGLSFELPLRNTFLIRICIIFIAAIMFSLPVFRDYSSFFPTHYDMDVFFDDEGVNKSFDFYSPDEIQSLKIAKNWREEKSHFLTKLSSDASKIMGVDSFFNKNAEYLHSRGHTSFFVEKVQGLQNYYIREASGQLTHMLELPNTQPKQFHSRFELMYTGNNYISVSLWDIYFKYTKILMPHFKQVGSLTPAGDRTIFHHYVIALIKVQFFPILKISNTIYLIKASDGMHWIPTGYAVYRPSR